MINYNRQLAGQYIQIKIQTSKKILNPFNDLLNIALKQIKRGKQIYLETETR